MNIHELIKEEIDNYLREEEYFTNQLPDDRKAHKNRYIGRNVVWYGSPEQMIVVDKDNVHGMWGNIYDNDKLKYVEDIIRNSDDYVELECSYALASVVRLIDVIEHQTSEKNDHFYTDYDGFDSPHSTGNPEVDTYLGTEDMDDLAFVSDWVSQLEIIKFFEDHKLDIVGGENSLESLKQQFLQLNPDEEEMEAFEGFIALEEAVKEAYDTNSGDLGDLSVQLRDAHHRVFGAIAAGENFICVNLDVNDIQRFSDYITRVGTSGPVPQANENINEKGDNYLMEKDPMTYNDNLLIDEIKKIGVNENLPTPTNTLDSGSDAKVYNTINPNVLIRVEELDEGEDAYNLHEYILADSDIQETGGVAEIYHIDTYEIGDNEYLISWKEKIEENFEHIIWKNYDKEVATNIMYALHLYDPFYDRKQFDTLRNTKETSKLYDAIMAGLPLNDLSPDSNMGVNNKGYIVAFDV